MAHKLSKSFSKSISWSSDVDESKEFDSFD
jgi:hypothetical protein